MERKTLSVILRDHLPNEEIGRRTNVVDIEKKRVAIIKWTWVGTIR